MNGNQEDMTPITGRQLERLVDGEMSEADRRALLVRLDDEPGGWRQCALAFLEAQCFREALAPLGRSEGRAEVEAAESGVKVSAGAGAWAGAWRRSPRVRAVVQALAMAASFMVALGLGWWWHGEGPTPTQVAQSGIPGNGASTDAAKRDQFPAAALAGSPAADGSPWRMVTLSVPGGEPGQRQAIRVPAMERNTIDGAWLNGLPGLPPDVLQALKRTGHQVQQSRQLMPVQLEDGRRLVVPVDQFEVRYVGNGYQ
jgi:hypothetical protein